MSLVKKENCEAIYTKLIESLNFLETQGVVVGEETRRAGIVCVCADNLEGYNYLY
jgi:hypothetical protein